MVPCKSEDRLFAAGICSGPVRPKAGSKTYIFIFSKSGAVERVRPKKNLGQHFLKDKQVAAKICALLSMHGDYGHVLEIGPGTGVLTATLLADPRFTLSVSEVDAESVAYLKAHLGLGESQFHADFLALPLENILTPKAAIIGNLPYNISSQIFFKVLEHVELIPEMVCMIQKEVAQRIASPPGSKVYGILSVLLQAFYDIKLQFKVPPGVFFPPPKVDSAVLTLRRNTRPELGCNKKLFFQVVKLAFGTRRKTLRNALKTLQLPSEMLENPVFDRRAEQLSTEEFILLTKQVEDARS